MEAPPVDWSDLTGIPTDIADGVIEPGVEWYDWINVGYVVTDTIGNVASITVNAPSSGFVIVTSSGWINWLVNSSNQGVIELGLSHNEISIGGNNPPSADLVIGIDGISKIGYYRYPFSITRVFAVDTGSNSFYFNCRYSTLNQIDSSAWVVTTLVGLFVPNRY